MANVISNLRKELRRGVLKKNKFKIEIYVPGEDSRSLDLLCQEVDFPQKNISPSKLFRKGRPVFLRGETEFGNSQQLTFLEDSEQSIRRIFEFWYKQVDNPESVGDGNIDTGVVGGLLNAAGQNINSQISVVNNVKNIVASRDLGQAYDFLTGNSGQPQYMTNVRIWQLDGSGDEVYGYELQNQFVSQIGEGKFSQGQSSEAQMTSVTLTFSESIPLQKKPLSNLSKITGTETTDTLSRIKNLF